ncbi:MAG TPA: FAD-binding domain [bacterium]|nr:FAD-binding domain [bacterium]
MRILISGAGIAGPTLAYWLAHYGFQPTLVEKSPQFRRGGYVIDFWGTGFDVADRMGLVPDLTRQGYLVEEVRVVDPRGKPISGFPVSALMKTLGGRFVSIPRGDLAAAIYGKIEGRVEALFGDSVKSIAQDRKAVRVCFERGPEREFDLVIGADGLHSRVRELVFGPQERFETYLGYKVAAFEAEGYEPRDELVYVMFTEVGQMLGRFTLRGNRTLFIFIFADDDPGTSAERFPEGQKALLRKRFGQSGWECGRILDALDSSRDLYFDRVSQIRMDPAQGLWSRGRVALLGDAAFCVSLLAGQGSALAMAAAYALAGELHRSKGDYPIAFSRYQDLFGPFVAGKQRAAVRFGGAFAPKTRLGLFFRNQVMKTLRIPWIANQAFSRDLSDKIQLPQYE